MTFDQLLLLGFSSLSFSLLVDHSILIIINMIFVTAIEMIRHLLIRKLTRKTNRLLNSGEMIIIQITIFITHCHCLISYNNTILMKEDFQ